MHVLNYIQKPVKWVILSRTPVQLTWLWLYATSQIQNTFGISKNNPFVWVTNLACNNAKSHLLH